MKLLILPMGEVDLEEIALRIGADHPESAKRFLLRAAKTFERLARLPYLGARLGRLSLIPEGSQKLAGGRRPPECDWFVFDPGGVALDGRNV